MPASGASMSRSTRSTEQKFKAITRWGDLAKVMAGIAAAQAAGLADQDQRRGAQGRQRRRNPGDDPLGAWRGHGPHAHRDDAARRHRRRPHRPVSAAVAGARAARRTSSRSRTSPTRPADRRAMCEVKETGGRLGFITPLTHNFCESCNRVRLTCTGTLFMCLGQEDAADLRAPLRASEGNELLDARHRRGDLAQAQGPRFHHRPAPQQAGLSAPYERHRRLAMDFDQHSGRLRNAASEHCARQRGLHVDRAPEIGRAGRLASFR